MKLEFGQTPHLGRSVISPGGPERRLRSRRPPLLQRPDAAGARRAAHRAHRAERQRQDHPAAHHRRAARPAGGRGAPGRQRAPGLHDPGPDRAWTCSSTPLETRGSRTFANQTEARSFLAYFLFTGDEPLKPNALLSYGQRARLMLALLVAQGCNCLLLDEPVNHLDIPSRAQFEQALNQFEGAVLAVVHDRYFIERFADEVWWVEGQGIRQGINR